MLVTSAVPWLYSPKVPIVSKVFPNPTTTCVMAEGTAVWAPRKFQGFGGSLGNSQRFQAFSVQGWS